MNTIRDSLVLDDLQPGNWYEFIRPSGHVLRGTWEGFEGRLGAVHLPAGTLSLFPHGVTLLRPCSYWSECIITEMPNPDDELPMHVQRDRLDAAEPQPGARRDVVITILAVALFWVVAILWWFR